MVDRKKKLKLCDKVSQEDRISKLPDSLISEILSHISTRDVVRTGALSTRWRNIWQWVPALDLDYYSSFPKLDAFVSFAERFIDSQKESWIRKLSLSPPSSHHEKSRLTRVIDAVTRRRIQHLSVDSSNGTDEIPLSIFTCKTLVHLQLCDASLPNAEFVSLPCLKIMHLVYFRDPNKAMFQKLILGSPVLEDLRINSHSTDDGNVLQVCSQTVKKIYIRLSIKVVIDAPLLVDLQLYSVTLAYAEFVSLPCLKIMHLNSVKDPSETAMQKLISGSSVLEDLTIIGYSTDNAKILQIFSQTVKRIQINLPTKVVIDAPVLQYLKTMVFSTNNFEIISLGISTKLDIVAALYGHQTFSSSVIHDILTCISRVRDLVISNDFWKDIFLYSKSRPLLQFGDLSRLDAGISKSNFEMLPTILEGCPKLESFILTLVRDLSMHHKKKKEPKVMFSAVPLCLVSSLKFVELKRLRTTGYEGEKELVRYLLKNSTMLQTLKLDIYYPENANCGFLQELLTMPRCSSACEIHCSFIAKNKW